GGGGGVARRARQLVVGDRDAAIRPRGLLFGAEVAGSRGEEMGGGGEFRLLEGGDGLGDRIHAGGRWDRDWRIERGRGQGGCWGGGCCATEQSQMAAQLGTPGGISRWRLFHLGELGRIGFAQKRQEC